MPILDYAHPITYTSGMSVPDDCWIIINTTGGYGVTPFQFIIDSNPVISYASASGVGVSDDTIILPLAKGSMISHSGGSGVNIKLYYPI